MDSVASFFGGPRPSQRRSHSPARSSSTTQGYFVRPHHSPARSSNSTRGYFVRPHQSGTSSYKRRPRDGYIARLIYQIKKILRSLMDYARRNPGKLFMMVVMPLITGGALTKVLASFGVRLPAGLGAMAGVAQGAGKGAEGFGLGEVMNIAKMFI